MNRLSIIFSAVLWTAVFLGMSLYQPVLGTSAEENDKPVAPLLEGMGDLSHPVTTSSPAAQRFFDQGLVLAFGFNHAEARRSFQEAARLDPEHYPENGWSLYGLYQALKAQGKDSEAAQVKERFEKAWASADVKLTASRF